MKILHNEEARQINIMDERFYTADGETYYPSVTTVLEAFPKGAQFEIWRKSTGFNADIIVDRAAKEGSNIHEAIERLLNGETLSYQAYNKTEWQCICRFAEFWTRYSPGLIASECMIVSDHYRIGGTIDIVCMINGERWLIDAKSSNAVYDTHELQLAMYAMMWNMSYPDQPIQRTGVLHLKALTRCEDKKGDKIQGKGWQLVTFDRPYQVAYHAEFVPLRAIWDAVNPDYKPAILTLPDSLTLSL